MSPHHSRMLSAAEVAGRLGVSTRSVTRWTTAGRLPGVRLGNVYRYAEATVMEVETSGLSGRVRAVTDTTGGRKA